ncbi:MAG: mechanosensitive ion channel protein MscS [Caulobacter sp. 12-67-6]|nr:MAG: mechanosensitive ion channel protein MscS [Caulobacter sp. 12-67-6]OYX72781.1 MAG: mechanosensitive ion channel protein MscS [Caulobacter sp. 32-67-35]
MSLSLVRLAGLPWVPAWAPPWAISLALIVLAIVVAIAAHQAASLIVRRGLASSDAFWPALAVRARRPTRLAFIVTALSVAVSTAPFTETQAAGARHGLLILLILLLGWIVMTALDIAAALYLRRFRVDVEDNLLARKHLTQVRILRRASAVIVGIFTISLALMTIPGVRQWGVSLLAAGGAASLILGLALQPLLTNLIAGIQIAITQPIRIDDAVIVEKEWGNIEEINATYVVVRLWDWRRMVLPLSYFIQTPFQNWTRESAALIGTVMLYVDHAAPIDALRAKLEEIAKASRLWDGNVVNLAVTDITAQVLEVRCLVSGRNAPTVFDLRCEVREKMMAFIAENLPDALARQRIGLADAV